MEKRIFLSAPHEPWCGDNIDRLTHLKNFKTNYSNHIIRISEKDCTFTFVTCDSADINGRSPLLHVKNEIASCHGIIALGLIHKCIEIHNGKTKTQIHSAPTPWNEIEVSMAYAMEKPILPLAEQIISDKHTIFNRNFGLNTTIINMSNDGFLDVNLKNTINTFLVHCSQKNQDS